LYVTHFTEPKEVNGDGESALLDILGHVRTLADTAISCIRHGSSPGFLDKVMAALSERAELARAAYLREDSDPRRE
jgi:hypothetical protein